MKKLIVILLVLMIGGVMIVKNNDRGFGNDLLPKLITDVEFDTKLNHEYFEYRTNVSRKYSDDVGLSEWIGL